MAGVIRIWLLPSGGSGFSGHGIAERASNISGAPPTTSSSGRWSCAATMPGARRAWTTACAAWPAPPRPSRKIILNGKAKGYLELRQAPSDHRKKLVYPTPQCISEYEDHVDTFLRLSQELASIPRQPRDGIAL